VIVHDQTIAPAASANDQTIVLVAIAQEQAIVPIAQEEQTIAPSAQEQAIAPIAHEHFIVPIEHEQAIVQQQEIECMTSRALRYRRRNHDRDERLNELHAESYRGYPKRKIHAAPAEMVTEHNERRHRNRNQQQQESDAEDFIGHVGHAKRKRRAIN
jgi:hypothetical protein